MRKLIFLLLLNSQIGYCQQANESNHKIDSVFSSFLKFMVNDDSAIIEKGSDTICFYIQKRMLIIDFFENITGIFLERKPGVGNEGICRIETLENIRKWENWYFNKRDSLVWVNDNKMINNPSSESIKCIDYEHLYPNNIRFVGKKNEIPKSLPPKYIQEMIENLHPKPGPLPVKVVIKPNVPLCPSK